VVTAPGAHKLKSRLGTVGTSWRLWVEETREGNKTQRIGFMIEYLMVKTVVVYNDRDRKVLN
jgi:hypothetical protein